MEDNNIVGIDMKQSRKVKSMLVFTFLLISLLIPSYFLVTTKAATSEDWDKTLHNYTLDFQPRVICADNNYVYVIEQTGGYEVYCHILYRNNLTLKEEKQLLQSAHVNDAISTGTYLFVGGKAQNYAAGSSSGWNISKYSIPDMISVAEYKNIVVDFPEFFTIDDTYLYALGGTISYMIKLYQSNLTEAVGASTHDYTGTDYYYRGSVSNDGLYVYGSVGCKPTHPGYVGRHYTSNMTYKDSAVVADSGYHNMQDIIVTPVDERIILSESPTDTTGLLVCFNDTLDKQWSYSWTASGNGISRLLSYNQTHFIAAKRTGIIEIRYVSDGTYDWNYTAFDSGNTIYPYIYNNHLYAAGYYTDTWVLRDILLEEWETRPSFLSINGETNNSVTRNPIKDFNWTNIPNSISYTLQISNDSSFTDIFTNIEGINEDNYPDEYIEYTNYVEFTLPDEYIKNWEKQYYFRIKAIMEV